MTIQSLHGSFALEGDGVGVGVEVGVTVGTSVGTSVGVKVGVTVGTSVGVAVGWRGGVVGVANRSKGVQVGSGVSVAGTSHDSVVWSAALSQNDRSASVACGLR